MKYEAVIQEYLPVNFHPPDYPTCKYYLNVLLKVIDELAMPFIYIDSDEMVFSKLCEILWKNKDIYTKIILLLGGFHQLGVMQRLSYKRHFPKGYREWCINAKTVARGFINQAFDGRHYYRSMRMLKECFGAHVQFRTEKVTAQSRSRSVS